MKRFLSTLILCSLFTVFAMAAKPTNPVVIPQPQKMAVLPGGVLDVKGNFIALLQYDSKDDRVAKAAQSFREDVYKISSIEDKKSQFVYLGVIGYKPDVAQKASKEGLIVPENKEGYALSVTKNGITLIARDNQGLFYGLMTLRQLLKNQGGKAVLPLVKVEDYPKLAYRGAHVFTGKNALKEQKALLDTMAYYKMNNLVLQLDFMEFKSHPELWYEPMGERQSEIKELLAYAKDRYIEVAPMVNTPGHAEWIFKTGHHLDLAEDPSPTKEGALPYAIYVDNDSTYRFLFDLYDEVIDIFKPKYFHIGHDEPDLPNYVKFPGRSKADSTRELLERDLKRNAAYFKGKGIDVMLWGDTMLCWGDSPDACMAKSREDAIALRKLLKDLESEPKAAKFYICDWHYASAYPERYKSLDIFNKEGFPVIASTWYGPDNIRHFTKQAIDTKSLGLLQTTWAGFNFSIEDNTSCYDQFVAYLLAGEYSWSGRYDKHTELGYNASDEFWTSFKGFKYGQKNPVASSAVVTSKPGSKIKIGGEVSVSGTVIK